MPCPPIIPLPHWQNRLCNKDYLYAGTDDGIIQVTEDGGENWQKIEVGSIKGIPATAFVNDLRADLFDANTVYAALDNHKFGDFTPYLIKSTDAGKSWRSIAGNIPDRTLVWRMVQDHVKKDLLFAATEFGIYFTVDGGSSGCSLRAECPPFPFAISLFREGKMTWWRLPLEGDSIYWTTCLL